MEMKEKGDCNRIIIDRKYINICTWYDIFLTPFIIYTLLSFINGITIKIITSSLDIIVVISSRIIITFFGSFFH